MSIEGFSDHYPIIYPRKDIQYSVNNKIQYINSYPNDLVYHNQLEINKLNLKRDRDVALQIQKMENEIQQEKEKKSIWKKLCLCISCLFCCLLPCGC